MKNFLRWLRTLFHSFFYGMRGADIVITDSSPDSEIHENKTIKEHEIIVDEVTVDKYYRVFREANNYNVTLGGLMKEDDDINTVNNVSEGMVELEMAPEDGPDITATAVKKVWKDKPFSELLKTDGYKITLVQYAKDYENDVETRAKEAETGKAIDSDTNIFKVTREDTPRFAFEKYLRQVVVKENKTEKQTVIEFYFSVYARQFWKIDSLFIAEMERIVSDTRRLPDIFDFNSIGFVTDKAFGSPDLFYFEYKPLGYIGTVKYDGNYVVSFIAEQKTKEDLTEKYKTEELDKLYQMKAPKKDNIDINTIIRNKLDGSSN